MRKALCGLRSLKSACVQPLNSVRDVALCLKRPLVPFFVCANSQAQARLG